MFVNRFYTNFLDGMGLGNWMGPGPLDGPSTCVCIVFFICTFLCSTVICPSVNESDCISISLQCQGYFDSLKLHVESNDQGRTGLPKKIKT